MTQDQRKKRLKDPYKLVLLREETLQEVGSYTLTPLNVYIAVSVLLLFTAAIVFALIFFTPLKRYVPGYANVYNNPEYVELERRLVQLEEQLEMQRLYIERLGGIVDAVPEEEVIVTSSGLAEEGTDNERDLIELAPLGPPGSDRRTDEAVARTVAESADRLAYLFFIPPLKGQVSALFDNESGHLGVDIVAPRNTPVKAIMDGYVITADWTLETGNTVGIQHAGNVVSFYKHNARNLVELGEFVKAGEAVAIIGNTGELSTGPHLHFELWLDGKPVDPSGYIDFNQ